MVDYEMAQVVMGEQKLWYFEGFDVCDLRRSELGRTTSDALTSDDNELISWRNSISYAICLLKIEVFLELNFGTRKSNWQKYIQITDYMLSCLLNSQYTINLVQAVLFYALPMWPTVIELFCFFLITSQDGLFADSYSTPVGVLNCDPLQVQSRG